MRKELEKNYDHKSVEGGTYTKWQERKYFASKPDKNKKPYTIMIPPPNITSQLHMGHALNNTIQDILIRWKRMQGYNALWLPGTDHASIATEVKIVEKLAAEGLSKKGIGRDEFMKHAWAWNDRYGSRIVDQLKKLGSSCDWDRQRFTLDEGLSEAVLTAFVKLYNEGRIYRGERLINWCPFCKTTISDAEVDHEEADAKFYHFKYPINGTSDFISFATTRPETMLGDTAIAVNPDDERYAGLAGKTVTVPVVNRVIPIITDFYVEKEFGTGVVKITPAHDPNDFEVGARHNLPIINIMNDDGTINENGAHYQGFDRYEARKKIIEEFKSLGLFIKEENIKHSVGTHERCHKVIEPLIKLQWFVKIDELAKPALDVYLDGKLRIFPERYGKIYQHWLTGIRDWCISRQLWWGHRIPAYYCAVCGHMEVSKNTVIVCKKCGSTDVQQDEDCLDTWFSSALWPFSTLGWPENTEDLEYYYPTNVLVTAYDIIFFWVVRMVFSGLHYMKQIPFSDVLFTGLVRDSEGRKMSKSLGNGIDPLELIETYGADALRISLVTAGSVGNDSRFYYERMETYRNFNNKIWNAARFILMNFDENEPKAEAGDLTSTDKWIISGVNELSRQVTANLESYELNTAFAKVYDFIWDEFCDWYIEMVKPRLYNRDDKSREAALWTLKTVLAQALKLLHPCMPFITEEIYLALMPQEESIMVSSWPEYKEELSFCAEEQEISLIKDSIKAIRNLRMEMNIPPNKKSQIFVVSESEEVRKAFERNETYFKTLGFAPSVTIKETNEGIGANAVSIVVPDAVIYIPLAEIIDIAKELERLAKEQSRLQQEIDRLNQKLGNDGFIAKAPERVIAEEKEKREKYSALLAQVEEQYQHYKNM